MHTIHSVKFACVVGLAASLAGCGGFSMSSLNPWSWGMPVERAQTLPSDATAYNCDGGKQLVVRYLSGGEKSVMIVFPEREFRLDAAPSASGARYTNGSTTLDSKGNEAMLEESGSVTYANCKQAAR
jgi:membrane-bound inhibitor of C-type lysozyme